MEVWKDIRGFEGVYVVSNYGRVCSLNRVAKDKNERLRFYPAKMLIPSPNSQGYLRVQLKHNGKCERYFIHRLVALHFVENPQPDCYKVVNHLDNNYLNNKADNLEWTNHIGNMQHAVKQGRMKHTKDWLDHLKAGIRKNGRAVIGYNASTGKTVQFVCLDDCKEAGFQPSCVCQCCQGIRKSHKGFSWRYAE